MTILLKYFPLLFTLTVSTQLQTMQKKTIVVDAQAFSKAIVHRLAEAIKTSNAKNVQEILQKECNIIKMNPKVLINTPDPTDGATFLHYATRFDSVDVVRLLVKHGGDVTVEQKNVNNVPFPTTPLTTAWANNFENIVEYLLSLNKVKDQDILTCLWLAVSDKMKVESFIKKFLAYLPLTLEAHKALHDLLIPLNEILALEKTVQSKEVPKLITIQRYLIHTLHVLDLILGINEEDRIPVEAITQKAYCGNNPCHTMAEIGNPRFIAAFRTQQELFSALNNIGLAPIHVALKTRPTQKFPYEEEHCRYVQTLEALLSTDAQATKHCTRDGLTSLHMAMQAHDALSAVTLMRFGNANPDTEATIKGKVITPRSIATQNDMIKVKDVSDWITQCTRSQYHLDQLSLREATTRETLATKYYAAFDQQFTAGVKKIKQAQQAELARQVTQAEQEEQIKQTIIQAALTNEQTTLWSDALQQRESTKAAEQKDRVFYEALRTRYYSTPELQGTLNREQVKLREQRTANQVLTRANTKKDAELQALEDSLLKKDKSLAFLKAIILRKNKEIADLQKLIAASKTSSTDRHVLLDYQQKLLDHIASCQEMVRENFTGLTTSAEHTRQALCDQELSARYEMLMFYKNTMVTAPELSPPTTEAAASSNATEQEPEDQLNDTPAEQEFYESIARALNILARKMRGPVLYVAMYCEMPLTIINYLLTSSANSPKAITHNPYVSHPLLEGYQGYTTFHWAVTWGYVSVVHSFLFDEFGEIRSCAPQLIHRASSTHTVTTPLQTAIIQVNPNMVQLLVNAGATVDEATVQFAQDCLSNYYTSDTPEINVTRHAIVKMLNSTLT